MQLRRVIADQGDRLSEFEYTLRMSLAKRYETITLGGTDLTVHGSVQLEVYFAPFIFISVTGIEQTIL